jgi:hypothetical protein
MTGVHLTATQRKWICTAAGMGFGWSVVQLGDLLAGPIGLSLGAGFLARAYAKNQWPHRPSIQCTAAITAAVFATYLSPSTIGPLLGAAVGAMVGSN